MTTKSIDLNIRDTNLIKDTYLVQTTLQVSNNFLILNNMKNTSEKKIVLINLDTHHLKEAPITEKTSQAQLFRSKTTENWTVIEIN